jgi:tripartite-type tricarboxylate transporter receptor subunit TctC
MFWELFRNLAGVEMVHVPYRGGGPAVTDLLAGQVQAYFGTMASAIAHVKAGKLRALAVTTPKRNPSLPDIPAMAEFLPAYDASLFVGISAPKGTPAEIVERLNKEITAGAADVTFRQRIGALGDAPLALSTAEFAKLVAEETDKWAKVIRSANIKAE